MKKKDDIMMNKSQIHAGIIKALSNSLTLAGYSKDIIERGGNPSLSLGLYSFAIEEFGKASMLNDVASSNQKEYSVPSFLFTGKKSHDLKFKAAFSVLPKECTQYDEKTNFAKFDNFTQKENYAVHHKGGSKVIPKDKTEKFSILDILIDFKTRMNCFYLDWDEQNNNWKPPPKISPKLLIKSISEFETFLNEKLDNAYGSRE